MITGDEHASAQWPISIGYVHVIITSRLAMKNHERVRSARVLLAVRVVRRPGGDDALHLKQRQLTRAVLALQHCRRASLHVGSGRQRKARSDSDIKPTPKAPSHQQVADGQGVFRVNGPPPHVLKRCRRLHPCTWPLSIFITFLIAAAMPIVDAIASTTQPGESRTLSAASARAATL